MSGIGKALKILSIESKTTDNTMNPTEIYTIATCPFCIRAKMLLDNKGVEYTEYNIAAESGKFAEMRERSQRKTVPQIFIGDHHIGGNDDLLAAELNGELDHLLAEQEVPA